MNHRSPRRRGRERDRKFIAEIIAEKFPKLMKETDIQVQKAKTIPNQMNPKRLTPRLIIKVPTIKDKERILKAMRKPASYIQKIPHQIIS